MDYGRPAPREMSFRLVRLPAADGRMMRVGLLAACVLAWAYDLFLLAASLR